MRETLNDVEKADLSKIHSEINQIMNQRTNLIVLIITLFGFFMAAIANKEHFRLKICTVDTQFFLAVFFLGILLSLSYIARSLTRQFYILRSYLLVYGYSKWEGNYQEYRKVHEGFSKFGYSKTLRIIFFVLGSIVLLIAFADEFFSQKLDFSPGLNYIAPLLYVLIGVIYFNLVYKMYHALEHKNYELMILENWKVIKQKSEEIQTGI